MSKEVQACIWSSRAVTRIAGSCVLRPALLSSVLRAQPSSCAMQKDGHFWARVCDVQLQIC